jgi:hypothetical protein
MGKRNSRASGSAGRKVFSASSASTARSRPKAGAGAAEHYAFRHAKEQHGGIDLDADPLDTYALSVKKHKRANVSSALTREEEAPGPGGSSGRAKRRADADDDGDASGSDGGAEDGDAVRERLRKLVNSHELLELEGGSDDEELDSDSAFEDDDEGRGWGAAFVQKGKSKKPKAKKVRPTSDLTRDAYRSRPFADESPVLPGRRDGRGRLGSRHRSVRRRLGTCASASLGDGRLRRRRGRL